MNKKLKSLVTLFVLALVVVLAGCAKKSTVTQKQTTLAPTSGQPGVTTTSEEDLLDLSVRDVKGTNGVVAAANPYAANAGLKILQAGGNAFDAAVAVSFALGVVEPFASGVGGGGVMTAYDASTGKYVFYNFREFVPAAGRAAAYPKGSDDLYYGAKAPAVPTQVLGLLSIEEDFGALDRQTVMAPAISYAKDGFKVTKTLAQNILDNASVVSMAGDAADVFKSDGIDWVVEGDTLIQEDYGKVLQRISDQGVDGFYKGETAAAILAATGGNGGLMTQADLDYAVEHYPVKGTPLHGTYNGYDILTANTPSSGGIILIEALNMLEVYGDITKLGHNTAEYINVVSTALQLAYGDKRQYIADQNFVNVPITGLMSKAYAAKRWSTKFTEGKAYLGRMVGDKDYGCAAGGDDPWDYTTEAQSLSELIANDYDEHWSTTSFSVADKEGNIVSFTQTINHFWGCGVVPEGCGFYLNNQCTSFSFNTSSAQYIEPYKQPVSHIMPTIIMKDGLPFATFGSPGSMRIPSAVTEVALNLMVWGMDMQEAINANRFYSYAVASGDYGFGDNKKDLYLENGIYNKTQERTKLEGMGYYVVLPELFEGKADIDLYFGGVQGIKFNYDSFGNLINLHGGADPRRDGKALGY